MPHLFHVLCHHIPAHSATHLPHLPFATSVLTEAPLVAFDIPQQIQLQVGFGFPNHILGSVAVFLPGYLSLYTSFLCLRFARSNLFILAGFLAFLHDFVLTGMDSS